MTKGFYFRVLLVILSIFLAITLLTGCGKGTTQAPAPEKQAKQEAPANKDTGAKTADKAQPVAAAPAKVVAPKKGGTLTMAMVKEITTMNPVVSTMSVDRIVRHLLYESVLTIDKHINPRPGLVEKWEISPDGKEYTLHLRKNVKFHNGKTMTASDVKWSIEYVMEPKNAAFGRNDLADISSVEILDVNTIKLTLKQPNAAFIDFLASLQTMAVVPEGSLGLGTEKPAGFPPGTGPFKFVEYKPGQHVIVERFDDYWAQVPYLDRIIVKMPVPDENVRFAALRAGDLDLIQETPFQWIQKIDSGDVKNIYYTSSIGGVFRRMIYNVQRPPFDNAKVRQAFSYALDKQSMLDVEFWGFGIPVNEKMLEGSQWYLGVKDKYASAQPDKAKELLKEASYPNGLEVTMLTRQGDEAISQVVQQQLGAAGVKVKIEMVESSIEPTRRRNGDFQFAVSRTALKSDPYVATAKDFGTETGKIRASNYSGYSDPAMDALLEKLGIESDVNKRKDIYRQVMEEFWDELPEFYIGIAPAFWSMKDKVKGFEANDYTSVSVYEGGGFNYTWIDE